jgi:hypothetical protein
MTYNTFSTDLSEFFFMSNDIDNKNEDTPLIVKLALLMRAEGEGSGEGEENGNRNGDGVGPGHNWIPEWGYGYPQTLWGEITLILRGEINL